jgi:hypothetical protein
VIVAIHQHHPPSVNQDTLHHTSPTFDFDHQRKVGYLKSRILETLVSLCRSKDTSWKKQKLGSCESILTYIASQHRLMRLHLRPNQSTQNGERGRPDRDDEQRGARWKAGIRPISTPGKSASLPHSPMLTPPPGPARKNTSIQPPRSRQSYIRALPAHHGLSTYPTCTRLFVEFNGIDELQRHDDVPTARKRTSDAYPASQLYGIRRTDVWPAYEWVESWVWKGE